MRIIIIIHLVYIYFFSLYNTTKASLSKLVSLHFIKSNNKFIQTTLFIQRRPIAKVFTEHYSGSTIEHEAHLHRHTGSDLDIWQRSKRFRPGLEAKTKQTRIIDYRSLIAMRLLKHVFNQFFFSLPKTLRHDPPLTSY